jgi:uncharacterized protein (DUF362 family)
MNIIGEQDPEPERLQYPINIGGTVTSQLALFFGNDRYQNINNALDAIAEDVDLRGVEQVLVKPNFVRPHFPLSATHVDATRAVLNWLRARTQVPIIVGEGTASSSTWISFESYGYLSLPDEYANVTLMDLNADETLEVRAFDRRLRPLWLKASRTLLESSFRISVGPPKTHDTVLVTASLKNMIMGGLKGRFSGNGPSADGHPSPNGATRLTSLIMRLYQALPVPLRYNAPLEAAKMFYISTLNPTNKSAMHQSFPVMNLNLFALAPHFHPHLSVIDGFEAMEGDGPSEGDPVPWRIALASLDWLAADVTTAGLMGFDLEEVGYLYYCAQAGYGTTHPAALQVLGNVSPDQVARRFKRHASAHIQRRWESPAVHQHVRRMLATGE